MANKWVNLTDAERGFILNAIAPGANPAARSLQKKMMDAGKRIAISSAKGKGRALQQWVCARIADMLGLPFDNQDDQCLIHSREMGQAGVDVILRGEAFTRFPYDVECKSTEGFSLVATVKQAEANTKAGRDWLIVHKSKALSEPVVLMRFGAFESLFRERSGK